jgi:hypothetical protein
MVRLCLAIILLCSLTACSFAGKTASSQNEPSATERAAKKLAGGDSAVFKFSRQGYVEGKIQSIDGTRYKMLYGQSTQTADAVDVYPLPQTGAKVDLKPGDIVVAYRRDAYWPGAEVKSVSGDVIQVQVISDGDTLNVPNEKVIRINPAAAAEFKQYAKEVAFLKAAKGGRPHPPSSYKPKAGERVVAEWTDKTWYIGDVISASSRSAKIKWPASFPESELVLEKVLPYPAPNMTPAVNNFLVVKPERETSAFVYGQVTSVNGGTVEVKLADGKTRTARQGEFYLVN